MLDQPAQRGATHKKRANPDVGYNVRIGSYQSGRDDLNVRPLEPHSSALPGCATPRTLREYNTPPAIGQMRGGTCSKEARPACELGHRSRAPLARPLAPYRVYTDSLPNAPGYVVNQLYLAAGGGTDASIQDGHHL